jgi:dipeptidyl-peptidase-3
MKIKSLQLFLTITISLIALNSNSQTPSPDQIAAGKAKTEARENPATDTLADSSFNFMADRFADIQLLRYKVTGFEQLSLKDKKLAYFLCMAGLSGRDIFYDQKNKNNLKIRHTLEAILNTYKETTNIDEWDQFTLYCKRFFFANGIHHHYSADKLLPGFSQQYFAKLINGCNEKFLPMQGRAKADFIKEITKLIFDPNIDSKGVNLSSDDLVKSSANNFYENVSQKEVEEYYAQIKQKNPDNKSQIGFNSKTVKEDGKIVEKVYKSGGMYSPAIDMIIFWLKQALDVAQNESQRRTIELLLIFYQTGDPVAFDNYSVAWVKDTVSTMDFVNGFIEVYQDALQRKGSYESIVSMKDIEASKRIAAISKEAQWFEDQSPISPNHKKKNVTGISAKVITIIGEVGDAAPSTPIGINLPNNEWIREEVGSKSVSLGNIVQAYDYCKAKSPMIDEFGYGDEVKKRVRANGALAGALHTDMHEVIGHASGKINEGVGPTEETLKNYAGVLEEARADLVALYYIMDPKLVEIGVMPSLEIGKAQYDMYLLNGYMTQLQRIERGNNLEEAHMRNRQLISQWVFEQGQKTKAIEKIRKDNKTYLVINDYSKIRDLMGQLLREIQRIKSEGDFEAGKSLVETYGVKVDQALLDEVHARYDQLNIAPYMGFIQPKLVPVRKGNEITDVKIVYPQSFLNQMLEYGKDFGYLPVVN